MKGACSSPRSRALWLPESSSARSARITSFSLAQASGNTSASAVPWKSSSVRRAYSAPVFFEICRFTTVTTAPIRTRWSLHWPRVAVVRVPKSSTSTRYRARGWPEMKNPSTAFSRANRSCSDHGATSGSRARGVGSGACSPKRATWPDSRSPCRVCASPNAASSAATSWARCPPSESQAPASISASRTRLLQRRRSIRSHRSTRERYGPPAVRPARIDSIAPAPTFLIAPRPKRSEEHTSELQSLAYLVCRLLLEKKKNNIQIRSVEHTSQFNALAFIVFHLYLKKQSYFETAAQCVYQASLTKYRAGL